MADKPTATLTPAACCKEPIIIDGNDVMRRCASCGAEWERETREAEWKPIVVKPAK